MRESCHAAGEANRSRVSDVNASKICNDTGKCRPVVGSTRYVIMPRLRLDRLQCIWRSLCAGIDVPTQCLSTFRKPAVRWGCSSVQSVQGVALPQHISIGFYMNRFRRSATRRKLQSTKPVWLDGAKVRTRHVHTMRVYQTRPWNEIHLIM
jgi:hypothetical protein